MPIKSKKNNKNNKNIQKEISSYILNKGDICCEEDFKRHKIIDQIFILYQTNNGKTYLDSLNNDIMLFIGYFIDLQKSGDEKGMVLWNYLDEQMPLTKNKKKDEKNIKKLLKSLPLFYLLSFLGSAHYKQNS